MRSLLLLVAVAGWAWADDGDAAGAGEVTPEGVPEGPLLDANKWTVVAPPSAPRGEPVQLRYAFDRKTAHVQVVTMTTSSKVALAESKTSSRVETRLLVVQTHADGGATFRAPFAMEAMRVNGIDRTEMSRMAMSGARYEGRVGPDGRVVAGTVKIVGVANPLMRHQFENNRATILSLLPANPLRVGEVVVAPLGELRRRYGGPAGPKARVTGSGWHRLEGHEEVAGVRCAKLRLEFALQIESDHLEIQPGQGMPGTMKMKGVEQVWLGEDGYVRRSTVEVELEFAVQGQVIPQELKFEGTGGPRPVPKADRPDDTERAVQREQD